MAIFGGIFALITLFFDFSLTLVKTVLATLLFTFALSLIMEFKFEAKTIKATRGKSPIILCCMYALFSSQCNLPLLGGAFISIIASISLVEGMLKLLLFAVGVAIPVTILLYLSSKGVKLIQNKLIGYGRFLSVTSGILLLLYSLYIVLW